MTVVCLSRVSCDITENLYIIILFLGFNPNEMQHVHVCKNNYQQNRNTSKRYKHSNDSLILLFTPDYICNVIIMLCASCLLCFRY